MTISRRVFVKSGGLALVSLGLDPLFLARAAFASGRPAVRPSDRPTLVCLFQRGAVDGLNMIVPHGEPAYYQERPRIAVPADSVVDLDGHFGLHPSLAPLKELWDNKSLAAIHAIGSPDATRSHFDAQDYMETGTPGVKTTGDGWANRYCQHDREHADTPFRAVAVKRVRRQRNVSIGNGVAIVIEDADLQPLTLAQFEPEVLWAFLGLDDFVYGSESIRLRGQSEFLLLGRGPSRI